MMKAQVGISKSGEKAEKLFASITGADLIPNRDRASGDAMLDGRGVEVKKASKTTINQVRAVKYLTLVVHSPDPPTWWVVPASEVVRLVHKKKRGQHTENPFECATLSTSKLGDWKVSDPQNLRAAVIKAHCVAANDKGVRDAMKSVLEAAQKCATSCNKLVERALSSKKSK